MEDSEQKPKLTRKRRSNAKEVVEETAIPPRSDTLSAPLEGQAEASDVKVEKRVSRSKGNRPRKQKNEEQRVEASAEIPGRDLAPSQPVPIISQPTVGASPVVAPMSSQREVISTATPEPVRVEREAVSSVDKDKENTPVQVIRQKLYNGIVWTVQVCVGAIITILLGFNQPASHIPILEFIERQKLLVLVVLCVVVLLILGTLVVFLTLDKLRRPMDARLKAMGAVTSVSTLSCLLCLSLLGITLGRPSWCPASLCPAPKVITKPITTTQGSHDANLDVYFISYQSATYAIPGNPQKPDYIPSSGDPRSIGVMQLNPAATATPYTIAIGLHSLYTGRYSILIDKVMLLVTKVNAAPDPLKVYPVVLLTTYNTTNPSRFVYQGQQAHQTIPDTYSTSLFPRVELTSGEPDQIDAAIESRIPVDLYFRIQVTYHIATQGQHILILPQVFEVVFSNLSNWQRYQLNLTQQNFVPAP